LFFSSNEEDDNDNDAAIEFFGPSRGDFEHAATIALRHMVDTHTYPLAVLTKIQLALPEFRFVLTPNSMGASARTITIADVEMVCYEASAPFVSAFIALLNSEDDDGSHSLIMNESTCLSTVLYRYSIKDFDDDGLRLWPITVKTILVRFRPSAEQALAAASHCGSIVPGVAPTLFRSHLLGSVSGYSVRTCLLRSLGNPVLVQFVLHNHLVALGSSGDLDLTSTALLTSAQYGYEQTLELLFRFGARISHVRGGITAFQKNGRLSNRITRLIEARQNA